MTKAAASQPARQGWCRKGGSRGWITTRAITWTIGKKGSPWRVMIPVGFEFESSVPRGFRWVLHPDDPAFLLAAAVHDWLLEHGYRTRFADGEWLEAARSTHAPAIKREGAFVLMRLRRIVIGKNKGTPK